MNRRLFLKGALAAPFLFAPSDPVVRKSWYTIVLYVKNSEVARFPATRIKDEVTGTYYGTTPQDCMDFVLLDPRDRVVTKILPVTHWHNIHKDILKLTVPLAPGA